MSSLESLHEGDTPNKVHGVSFVSQTMTPSQLDCWKFIVDVLGPGCIHEAPILRTARKIELCVRGQEMATFDDDYLTVAVVLAHDRGIRFCISPAGPGFLHWEVEKYAPLSPPPAMEDHLQSIRSRFS